MLRATTVSPFPSSIAVLANVPRAISMLVAPPRGGVASATPAKTRTAKPARIPSFRIRCLLWLCRDDHSAVSPSHVAIDGANAGGSLLLTTAQTDRGKRSATVVSLRSVDGSTYRVG